LNNVLVVASFLQRSDIANFLYVLNIGVTEWCLDDFPRKLRVSEKRLPRRGERRTWPNSSFVNWMTLAVNERGRDRYLVNLRKRMFFNVNRRDIAILGIIGYDPRQVRRSCNHYQDERPGTNLAMWKPIQAVTRSHQGEEGQEFYDFILFNKKKRPLSIGSLPSKNVIWYHILYRLILNSFLPIANIDIEVPGIQAITGKSLITLI
jgi:hypothetical protein